MIRTKARYGHLIKWILSSVDILLLNVAFIAAFFLCDTHPEKGVKLTLILLNCAYLIVVLYRNDIHDQRVLYADHVMMHAVKSVAIHAGIFLSILAFLEIMLSLPMLVYLYGLFGVSLVAWWLVSRKLLKHYRNKGFNYRNVIVIGGGKAAKRFITEISGDMGYGFHIVKTFGTQKNPATNRYEIKLDEIEEYISNNTVDEMYCSVPDTEGEEMTGLIRLAENNAIDFFYIPQLGSTVTRNFSLMTFGNVPVMAVRPHPYQSPVNQIIKRTFDLLVSSIVMILSPLVLIPVGIAIKCTSPGPIFFKQKRTGYRGKDFMCYKFRTMSVTHNSSNGHQVTQNDPEVTKLGRFLRHYSIDELPQFYNVFKGDMSIVGPRPHMVQHTEMYRELIDKYMLRHIIKPGITGWAQVLGYRGNTSELWMMEKRVECDVWYAENWNIMLDIKIMLLTVINAVKGEKNAY